MNGLSDPGRAGTVSGADISPCSQPDRRVTAQGARSAAPVGTAGVPPSEAPAELPLQGLRRTLADYTPAASALTAQLGSWYFVKQGPPSKMCGWAHELQELADEVASHAIVLRHQAEILWEQAAAECSRRHQAELDAQPRPTIRDGSAGDAIEF